jgi:hypothetical protein
MNCPYIETEDIFTCTVRDLYTPSLVEMEWYCLNRGKSYKTCPFFVSRVVEDQQSGMRDKTVLRRHPDGAAV